ncbi:hypothetical protein E4T43_01367 [Aureobasidium subglaciale]|nr:hypothetical protein E4T43_01367 [Aureobasidium subglaciale]
MFLQPSRKRLLTTYSKKPSQTRHRAISASLTSYNRQQQKRQIILTSPARKLPSSPSSISLSPPVQSDYEEDGAQEEQANLDHSRVQDSSQLTTGVHSDRAISPASSSDPESISEGEPALAVRGRRKRAHVYPSPQPLSSLRRLLKLRPSKMRLLKNQSAPDPSAETLMEIEKGADGFDAMHLDLLVMSNRRNRKRNIHTHQATMKPTLEIIKGPHPPVEFDHSDWANVPYQNLPDQKLTPVYETVEPMGNVPRTGGASTENTHPEHKRCNSPTKRPDNPSAKDILLYAQLCSVLAPTRRRSTYSEGDVNDDFSEEEHE